MREDHMENLERMFPQGYLIIYTCPDRQLRFNMWNPMRIPVIEMWKEAIIQSSRENPQEFWKGEEDGRSGDLFDEGNPTV